MDVTIVGLDIVIIGYGNLGKHLAYRLASLGVLKQVFNRSEQKLIDLPSRISSTSCWTEILPADIYILCVSDDAINSVSHRLARNFEYDDVLVVHTSGSRPIDEIQGFHRKGFFYPLYSFSDSVLDVCFSTIPIYVGAEGSDDSARLVRLASGLSDHVKSIDEPSKKALHVAAVMANNFSNLLISEAEEICEDYDIDFHDFTPMLLGMVEKLKYMSASQAQTGPAIRNDQQTIEAHMAFLKEYDPDKQMIYRILTERIKSKVNKLQS